MNRLTLYANRLPVSIGSGPVIYLPAPAQPEPLFAYSNQKLLAIPRDVRDTALNACARLMDNAVRYLAGELPADNLTDMTRQFAGELRRLGREHLNFAAPDLHIDDILRPGLPAYGPRSAIKIAKDERLAEMVAALTGLSPTDKRFYFDLQLGHDGIERLYIRRLMPLGCIPKYEHSKPFARDEVEKCKAWLAQAEQKYNAALNGSKAAPKRASAGRYS